MIQSFEKRAFKLREIEMLQAPESVLAEHHQDLRRKIYSALISYLSPGLVVVMVWEGPNVVCI